MAEWRVPFGSLKITESAKRRLNSVASSDWVSEGCYVREFEEKFAEKFGWRYAIATSSGTDAGIVVWAAIRELSGLMPTVGIAGRGTFASSYGAVITPACAFVATMNCIMAAGLVPAVADISIHDLNLSPDACNAVVNDNGIIGIQFVATMGKPSPLIQVAEIADKNDLWLVGDFCEAHGAKLIFDESASLGALPRTFTKTIYADHFCDASIYSFYAAHMVVGGEGGIICTNNDELASMCRSVKSHGRPASGYFDFQRIGYNSKWNEFCAAVALGSLEHFDETFERRRDVRAKLLRALEPFESKLILYRDGPGEIISPHAFPIVLRYYDALNSGFRPLYCALEAKGIQCKTLFGSLPTQHQAFKFLGYEEGTFPVAERVGRTGLHFGCHEFMTDDDVGLIADTIGEFFDNIY